jgi:hypothetical protein
MTPSPEPTYALSVISKALDIPPGTLATWARRGWMANFHAAKERQRGRAQQFDQADVLALALIRLGSEHGVTAPELIAYFPTAVRDYLDHPEEIRQLIIGWSTEPRRPDRGDHPDRGRRSHCSIRYNDDIMKEPAAHEPEVAVTFNLKAIFGAALDALERAVKSDSGSTETHYPELDISRSWRG